MFKMTLILVLLLFAAVNVSAKVFKWVDEKGVIHYSETPPPKQKATELQVEPPPPVAGNEGANPETERWQKLEAEYQKRKAVRQAAEKVKELKKANAQRLADEKCKQAQKDLYSVEHGWQAYKLNKKGELERMDSEMRTAEINRIKQNIETYCKQP